MKVEKVSATIRYSQAVDKGAWKVIEIGADGTVDARENWQSAQAFLCHELGQQLRQLWNNGNGAALNGAGGAESHGEQHPEPTPVWVGNTIRTLVRRAPDSLYPEEW